MCIAAAVVMLFSGSKDDGKLRVNSCKDSKKMPSMSTVNVSTLISDLEIIKYMRVYPL